MIQLGRVKGNKMVNMQLSNKKLVDRGTRMIVEERDVYKRQVKGAEMLDYKSLSSVNDPVFLKYKGAKLQNSTQYKGI